MPNTGYCTLDDVRRALRSKSLPGDVSQDNEIAVDAITSQTEPLEKELKRHWYEPDGINEDSKGLIPTASKSRDDEEDIPTGAGHVVGEPVAPKTSQGSYAKIMLARRDAESITALHVRTGDGTYEDWVDSNDYTEGEWPPSGEDYYLRVNNGGWSRLYLDTTNLLEDGEDDEYVLDSFANAVYLEFAYGHEGIPKNVRRAVAFRAAADLVEEPSYSIPDNSEVYGVESKAQELRDQASELLEVYT